MPKRVLHSVTSLEQRAGSQAMTLPGLCAALRSHDIESEIVTSGGSSPRNGDITVHDFGSASLGVLLAKFDLIHIHGWSGDPATRAVASHARRARKPYTISPLGSLMPNPLRPIKFVDRLRRRFVDAKLLRAASTIAALNEKEAAALRALDSFRRVVVLPTGLDFDAHGAKTTDDAELPTKPEGRCLLMLGPIDPVEGHVILLKSLAELGRDGEGWHVALVGEEREHWKQALEAAVRRKGAVDRVQFARGDSLATQQAWLARADLLAAPSLGVRPAVSVLQAIAAGVPALATDLVVPTELTDAAEICEPSRSGVKSALGKMMRMSDEERGAFALRARQHAIKACDWSVLARRYADCYEECCSLSRRL